MLVSRLKLWSLYHAVTYIPKHRLGLYVQDMPDFWHKHPSQAIFKWKYKSEQHIKHISPNNLRTRASVPNIAFFKPSRIFREQPEPEWTETDEKSHRSGLQVLVHHRFCVSVFFVSLHYTATKGAEKSPSCKVTIYNSQRRPTFYSDLGCLTTGQNTAINTSSH